MGKSRFNEQKLIEFSYLEIPRDDDQIKYAEECISDSLRSKKFQISCPEINSLFSATRALSLIKIHGLQQFRFFVHFTFHQLCGFS